MCNKKDFEIIRELIDFHFDQVLQEYNSSRIAPLVMKSVAAEKAGKFDLAIRLLRTAIEKESCFHDVIEQTRQAAKTRLEVEAIPEFICPLEQIHSYASQFSKYLPSFPGTYEAFSKKMV